MALDGINNAATGNAHVKALVFVGGFAFASEDKHIPVAAYRFMAERAGSRRTSSSTAARIQSR